MLRAGGGLRPPPQTPVRQPDGSRAPLPPATQRALAAYLPALDMRDVRVAATGAAWERKLLDLAGATAITVGRFIVARPGSLDLADPDGLALLAHELVHVEQMRRQGLAPFAARYLWAYVTARLRGLSHREAYLANPFEVEAFAMQERVATELMQSSR